MKGVESHPQLTYEPAAEYHARAGEYLSSHLLADFRKCPYLYYRKRFEQLRTEERPAFLLGRAAHVLILEGIDRFDEEFAVGGPINPNTGECYGPNTKAFAAWAEATGKSVLTVEQFDVISRMNQSVRAHRTVCQLLHEGVAEAVVRTDYLGVPSQTRMDWFDAHQGIVDLKTCDDLTWFEADARRYGYAHQLTFYRAVLAQVIGLAMPVHLVAVEKREPFRTGVWKLSDDTLLIAQRDNEAGIERLKRCLETGQFPTGYEETRVFDSV